MTGSLECGAPLNFLELQRGCKKELGKIIRSWSRGLWPAFDFCFFRGLAYNMLAAF